MKRKTQRWLLLLALLLPMALQAQTYHSVPYVENFENPVESTMLPTGWVNYATDSTPNGVFPAVVNNSSAAHDGEKYLRMEGDYRAVVVTATPEFEDLSQLMIDFYCYVNTSHLPTAFEVGVMEDSLFVPMDTVAFSSVSSGYTYYPIQVYFNNYSGNGHRIAFRTTRSSSIGMHAVYIDNLVVSIVPPCPLLPGEPMATDITAHSATLSWGAAGMSMGYGLVFADTTYTTTSTSITLTGLDANVTYRGSIFNVCPSGDTSSLVPFVFRTDCGPLTLPYTEDFEYGSEEMPVCWYRPISNNDDGVLYPRIALRGGREGSQALLFMQGQQMAASPFVPVPANELEVSGWIRSQEPSDLVVGFLTGLDSTAVFYPIDTIHSSSFLYSQFLVSYEGLPLTDSGHVAFMHQSDMYPGIQIDDVVFRRRSGCPTPMSLQMTATRSGQVTLGWQDSTATRWQIAYGPQGFNPNRVHETALVSTVDYSVTISGLDDSVVYDFYLRGVCDSTLGNWGLPVTVQPGIYSMRMDDTITVRTCNARLTDDGGPMGDYFHRQTSYMVVYPEDSGRLVSLTGTTDLFDNINQATLTVYDGVGTTGTVLAEYVGQSQVRALSSSGPLTLKLNSNFENSNWTGEGFDLTVSCTTPDDCPDPYGLTVDQVAGASVRLNWNYWTGARTDYWAIEVIDPATDSVRTYIAPDTVRSFLLGGLDQQTSYVVRMQAFCLSGDTSSHVTTSFSTVCYSGGFVQVGNGSIEMGIPIATSSNYSYCQMLFTATELSQVNDTIRGIRLFARQENNSECNIDIYIDTTGLSYYASGQDAIAMDSTHRVFSGTVSIHEGEIDILFDRPWIVPNTFSNIVLTIDNHTGTSSHYTHWLGTYASGFLVLNQNSTFTHVNPATASSNSTVQRSHYRPNVAFLTGCEYSRCVAPNVSATVRENTAVLNWAAGHDETLWSVEYKRAADTVWTLVEASTSNNTATIAMLDAGVLYDFRVSGLCSDSTASTYVQLRTDCWLITADHMPFSEDFENFTADSTTDDMEECWYRVSPYFVYYDYSPYIVSDLAHSGSRSLLLDSYGNMLVLPQVGEPVDRLYLSFFTRTNVSSDIPILIVGVLSDPFQARSFVPLDTLRSGNPNEWTFQETTFENYNGVGRYVAVRPIYYDSYLDDLRLELNPDCRRVENITIVANPDSTATITFDDPASEGGYTIIWSTTNDVNTATDSAVCISSPAVIGPLADATFYYVWIRTNCASQSSLLTPAQRFGSYCPIVEVTPTSPFIEGFEGPLLSCYSQEHLYGSSRWEVIQSDTNVTRPLLAHGGNQLAYYHSSYDTTWLILPTFDFSTLDQGAILTFWRNGNFWQNEGNRIKVYARNSDTSDWWMVDDFPSRVSTWTQETVSLPQSQNSSFYQIAFTGGEKVLLDDLTVMSDRSCHRPDSLSAEPADTMATLTWVGNAAQYQIELENTTDGSRRLYTSTTNSLALSGLIPLASYRFRVRGVCGVGDSSLWSEKISFSTLICSNPSIYYSYNDELGSSRYDEVGLLGDGYQKYSYVQTLIDSANIASLRGDISAFALKAYSSGSGRLYSDVDIYMANVPERSLSGGFIHPDEGHIFVPVLTGADLSFEDDLFLRTSGWHLFLLDSLFAWDGHSNILVSVVRRSDTIGCCVNFCVHTTSDVKTRFASRNNVEFDPATATGGFTGNHVSDLQLVACSGNCDPLTVTDVTFDHASATLTWSASETGTIYQVQLKPAAATVWPAPVTVVGTSYSASGLIPYTRYDFRVRGFCADSSGASLWTMGSFTTEGVPCHTPTDLTVSNVAPSEATFTWVANGSEGQWDLHVWNTDGFSTFSRVSTNPAIVGGLLHNSTYNVAIRAVCGDEGEEGEYGDAVTFSTPYCPNVVGLTVSSVTAYSVTLTWDLDPLVEAWTVEYGPSGFEQGFGTTVDCVSNTCTIYGLEALTSYEFYVRAACGSEEWELTRATTLRHPDQHFTVTALVNNANWGIVEGGGSYYDGQMATLTAIPNDGYQFGNWSDGSQDNPYNFVVTSDVTIVANFLNPAGIADEGEGVACTLSPNPASGTTEILVRGLSGKVRISLMDMNGRRVATQTLDATGDCQKTIDLQGIAPGAYFVTVTCDKTSLVRKLIVR